MQLRCLKTRSVFLIGFGIGFVLTLVLSIIHHEFINISDYEKSLQYQDIPHKNVFPELFKSANIINKEIVFQHWNEKLGSDVTYNKWLESQNLKVSSVDMDKYLYGPKKKKESESTWLGSNIHITCVVFVKKSKMVKSIKDTWGKRCNSIYFFSQHVKNPELPIIDLEVKLISSWQFLCEAFNYIWKDKGSLEWLIVVKDDTVVIPENLRYMVAPLNHTHGHYLGHAVVMWGQSYNLAQAGYVISQGSLSKLVNTFNTSEKCSAGGKYWKKEDYYLAKHLSTMGIYPSDTRDQYLRGTFHGYSLLNLLWGVARPGSYWTHAVYPVKEKSCSPLSVTFSAGESDKMYTLDYLLYHLHILRTESFFGSKRAPKPIPEKDVWRSALKEEFNITYNGEISSDAYFEIWHTKYSEPEQLIAKNYQSMPDVLSSVLTAYELESKSLDKVAS